MKIAVIGAKGVPPKQGGIEHICAEIYPRMVAKGHTVDLFARSSYTDLPAFHNYDFEGVRVISLPCLGMRGVDAFSSSAIGAAITGRGGYDIIHFHALGPSLFAGLPKLTAASKVVVTCNGLDWQRDKWGKTSSRLIQMGEKAAVRFADEIIVVSETLRSYFLKTYDRDTIFIPNAPATYADSDPNFNYGKSLGLTRGKYVVYVGRLVPEKCPDLLIRAFQSLNQTDWKLVVIGGNSDTPSFVSLLNQLAHNDPNIVFAGELRGSRLAEIVRGAGIFSLPSNLEGLPLAMLEAMQEGIPIVASNIAPHQELLNGGRGLLFQAGDEASFAKSLGWAIQHPEDMKVMADKAQKHVSLYYTWDRIVDDHLKVFESVLNRPKLMQEETPRAVQTVEMDS
jgi:glycosyltransferase involved in cell wall biosynthesis